MPEPRTLKFECFKGNKKSGVSLNAHYCYLNI